MPGISSPGLGSGLNVNDLVTKLMAVESRPLTVLTNQEAKYQAKLSAFGTVQGALSALQTAAQTLKTTTTFTSKSASVSDSTVLTASAASTATAGTYDIAVSKLAKANTIRTNVDYGADTFDSGTLDITIGGGTPVTVTLTGANTLSGIRDAINAATAGVTATIINDGTADRLVLTSNTTGAAGAITVAAPTSNNDGTRRLTDLIGVNLTSVQAAQNAEFTVNGLAVSRASNTVTDVISGVTLSLLKADLVTPPTAKVTIAANTDTVTTAVNAFVKAYNDVVGQLKTLTAYDAVKKTASVLTGDGTARAIQSELSSLVSSSVTGISGGISTLSDIGVTVQKDGTLATNSSKLATVLADPDNDVAALFSQTTVGNEGVAVRFNNILQDIVGTDGLIESRTDGLNTSIKDVQDRELAMTRRLTQIEARYRAQFTALDTLISNMQSTSQYLTQQLANLPGVSSSS